MTAKRNLEVVQSILREFQPISLEGMDAVKLLDRQDTKFIFGDYVLPCLLAHLRAKFKVLTIAGKSMLRYENLYFDTEDLLLYRQHHNEQLSRYKIRYRRYLDSGTSYFEIKQKNNKNRTIKRRIQVPDMRYPFDDVAGLMIKEHIGISQDRFTSTLDTYFTRVTLVGESLRDRVTIDFDIKVRGNGVKKEFHHLAIAEIKQCRYSSRSDFFRVMKKLGIQEMRLSKYCMGILATYPNVKYNRFKPKIMKINQIVSKANRLELGYG